MKEREKLQETSRRVRELEVMVEELTTQKVVNSNCTQILVNGSVAYCGHTGIPHPQRKSSNLIISICMHH